MTVLLSVGSAGDDVTALQESLATLGYDLPRTGVYDDQTQLCVMSFQQWAGVEASGDYDDPTAAALATMLAGLATGSAVGTSDQDLYTLETPQSGGEGDFHPLGHVAVRVDPTHYVLWGFPFRQWTLLPEHETALDEVAQYLVVIDGLATVDVVGHTSTSGANDINQELSEQRAAAVREALLARGVAAERIRAWGEGERQPLVAEDGQTAAMARNRRVELAIHAVAGTATPAPAPDGGTRLPWPQWRWRWPDGKPRIRDIIDPRIEPPADDTGILDRIRSIYDSLPSWITDRLDFDWDTGVLTFAGWGLGVLAGLLATGAVAAAAALGLGTDFVAVLAEQLAALEALEKALQELTGTGAPQTTMSPAPEPPPPHDAGTPPRPAGVDEPPPDAGPPDAGPPDAGSEPPRRQTIRGYHGSDGDGIIGIVQSAEMWPNEFGYVWLNVGDRSESYMHGADRARRAAFVIEVELTYDPTTVPLTRGETRGVRQSVRFTTNAALPCQVLRLFRRQRAGDNEPFTEEVFPADQILAVLRG